MTSSDWKSFDDPFDLWECFDTSVLADDFDSLDDADEMDSLDLDSSLDLTDRPETWESLSE